MADGGLGAVGAFSADLSSADWLSAASTLLSKGGGTSPQPTGASPAGSLSMSLKQSSAAESAFRGENSLGFDNSGMTVSTGSSKAGGGAMPSWAVLALIAFGMLVWLKSHKKK